MTNGFFAIPKDSPNVNADNQHATTATTSMDTINTDEGDLKIGRDGTSMRKRDLHPSLYHPSLLLSCERSIRVLLCPLCPLRFNPTMKSRYGSLCATVPPSFSSLLHHQHRLCSLCSFLSPSSCFFVSSTSGPACRDGYDSGSFGLRGTETYSAEAREIRENANASENAFSSSLRSLASESYPNSLRPLPVQPALFYA